uniref:uncharacterized protein LOC120329685 n=1 Tax=Styela clava TaxID=7725 RepID=UPI001939EA14|nr:uncharacterized protein LOC120329685 [Styela clava]
MAGRYKLLNPLDLPKEKKGVKDAASIQLENDDEPASPVQLPVSVEEIHERPVLTPLKDKEIMQSVGLVRQYLRDTGVNANMNKFTSALLQNNILPYNPYPGYIKRFRKLSEKFHTRRETLQTVQRKIQQCPTFLTGTGILSGVKLPGAKLWGLQHVLSGTNPKILNDYRSIIKSCTVDQTKISGKFGDDVALLPTITGPCIFSGSLHDQCFKLDVSVSVLVTTTDFQVAAKNLGLAILLDLEHISSNTDHLIISLKVPVISDDTFVTKTWSADEIQSVLSSANVSTKDEFVQAIGVAALKKHDTIVQLLAQTSKDSISKLSGHYIKVEKSYNLMTVMKSKNSGQMSLFISNAQYQALHEGLFIEKSDAEIYLSAFKKYSTAGSPLSQNVCNAVQKIWQERIAGKQIESNLTEILHHQFLMEHVQNQNKPSSTKNEDSLAIQIYRVLRGFGQKLEYISTLITTLNDIASSKFLYSDVKIFQNVFSQCQSCLNEFFDETAHELSSAEASARLVIRSYLGKIDKLANDQKFNKIKPYLSFMKGYIKAISFCLIEDSLEEFGKIRAAQSQINAVLQVDFGQDLNIDLRSDEFRHKTETTSFTSIDKKILDLSLTNVASPAQISPHAARMQYCIDVRIDEVWKTFMNNMLIMKNNLPANPYPSLVTLLRQASLKVQLFREDNSVIVRRLLGKPKSYDDKLKLFSIPGASAYGTYSAVSALNSVGFRQISTMASSVAIIPPQAGKGTPAVAAGAFELKSFTAISNEALLYGSVTPYISTITVNEYCFIKGSPAQKHDGILRFSKVLLINLGNLQTQGILPVRAFFSDVNLKLNDLNAVSSEFHNQFVSTVDTQQPIMIHLLMPLDWRYVLIKKIIHVYFVNEMTDDTTFLTKHDPLAPLCQVFLNGIDAAEYTRRIQIFDETNDDLLKSKIMETWNEFDWPSFAQFLLVQGIGTSAGEDLTEEKIEAIGFGWKLFHSPYGALHYSSAIAKAIREGLKYDIKSDTASTVKKNLKVMLAGYRNILNTTLTAQSTMSSSALNLYCQDLLQNAAPVGTVELTQGSNLPRVLDHVASITQAISDSIAMDLVECFLSIRKIVDSKTKY